MSRKITESYKKKLAAEEGYITTRGAELRIALCYPNTHGIGMAKRDYINRAIDPVTLDLMRAIKRQFDPRGILNPDKIFPPR